MEKKIPLPRDLSHLEATIGYAFSDRSILTEAMRHSSYVNEHKQKENNSNERLEFLGDSVLSVLASGYIFSHFPDDPEGILTKIRSDVVCTSSLAGFARKIGLGDYLLLGHGQEISGRDQDTILENAFEALLAAIYRDAGQHLDTVAKFVCPLIETEIANVRATHPIIDPKSKLQEIVQAADGELKYVIVSESGPDHDKRYECEARIDNNAMGRGIGSSKKKAEIAAAEDALKNYIVV